MEVVVDVGAGCSDAHDLDLQAAAEVGSNMTAAALAGTTFIHNLGFLSGGRTGSLEMLVLCDELAGMVGRLAAGMLGETTQGQRWLDEARGIAARQGAEAQLARMQPESLENG